jgi:hypothetical protein
MPEPERDGWADLRRLIDDVRRLAYDRTLDDADRARRIRDRIGEHDGRFDDLDEGRVVTEGLGRERLHIRRSQSQGRGMMTRWPQGGWSAGPRRSRWGFGVDRLGCADATRRA